MFGFIGNTSEENKVVFTGGSDTNTWQTWTKPLGCRFIRILAVGAGGGGGSGAATGSGTARGGGGGGGSGAISSAIFAANVLPDTLYIQNGVGGAGGSASGTGTTGGKTYVCSRPYNTYPYWLILSNGGSGGGGTSTTTAGAGGTGGIAQGGSIAYELGANITVAGYNGSAGGSGASASAPLYSITGIITGGAGGGGVNIFDNTTGEGSGGLIYDSSGYLPVGASTVFMFKTNIGLLACGGSGGDASTSFPNNGYPGGYGCGGGGGTAGTATPGVGGRGGDGFVIIQWW